MSQATVYLITCANRGLGLGLATRILEKNDHDFVYAGVRDPDNASSLRDLQTKYSGRMALVKCISADVEGNTALAKEIERRHGRLDTVVANAGICDVSGDASDVSIAQLEEHFHVNTTGTIVLFQAVHNLLRKSTSPRFVPISSSVACFNSELIKSSSGGLAYGASKVALNWATRKIHFENDWLVTFPLCPGVINTDMLHHNMAVDKSGNLKARYEKSPNIPTVEAVSFSVINLIDKATRDDNRGEFFFVDGTRLAW